MNIFKKAIKEAKELDAALTECKTPKFRKPAPSPKPNPNYTPPPTVKRSCTYSTPCGWCTKWDKRCDRKPYKREPSVKIHPVDDLGIILTSNKQCKSDSDHEWVYSTISTTGYTLICTKCGEKRNMPFIKLLDSLTSPSVVQEIINEVIKENKL